MTKLTNGTFGPPLDRRTFTLGLAGTLAMPSVVRAQAFPSMTIQIVVPNAAGGVNDVLARIIAQKLQDQFGKPAVVENRPGAGGDIGTESVLKAEPDGHTLVMGSIALTLGRVAGGASVSACTNFRHWFRRIARWKFGRVLCVETPYHELGWSGTMVEDIIVIRNRATTA